jgi:nucleotide-binding universal stress UspA family protein
MFNRILVPLDGSKLAEGAVFHARAFADIFNAHIVLLSVQDPSSGYGESTNIDALKWQILKTETDIYLQSMVSRLNHMGHSAEYHILEGNAAENIVNFATNENIDLVIISTHGWSGLSRWQTSSVTSKVIEKVYIPILLVRAYQSGSEPDKPTYQRILLPVDGSRRAETALPAAIAISEKTNAWLYLVNVIQRPAVPFTAGNSAETCSILEHYMKMSKSASSEYLESMKQRIPVKTETRVLEGKNIPQPLHDLVHQEKIDLIVMSAHGQTGLTDWPYGGVAWNLLAYGQAATLILQDIARTQFKPTPIEIAVENSGKR